MSPNTANSFGEDNRGDRDTERFLYLLTPIQGRIYAYILSRWPNRADADDIMQETIATLWKKFGTYQPGTNFLAWAITIAKYTTLSFQQKHNDYPIQFNQEAMKLLQEKSEEFINKMDDRLIALKNCVEKLSEKETKLLKMKYGQELPVQRIAAYSAISTRSVYKSLSLIHNALMRCIRRSLAEGGI